MGHLNLKYLIWFIVRHIFFHKLWVCDRICGASKFDYILNKCGQFCVGFASHSKEFLSPVFVASRRDPIMVTEWWQLITPIMVCYCWRHCNRCWALSRSFNCHSHGLRMSRNQYSIEFVANIYPVFMASANEPHNGQRGPGWAQGNSVYTQNISSPHQTPALCHRASTVCWKHNNHNWVGRNFLHWGLDELGFGSQWQHQEHVHGEISSFSGASWCQNHYVHPVNSLADSLKLCVMWIIR